MIKLEFASMRIFYLLLYYFIVIIYIYILEFKTLAPHNNHLPPPYFYMFLIGL